LKAIRAEKLLPWVIKTPRNGKNILVIYRFKISEVFAKRRHFFVINIIEE